MWYVLAAANALAGDAELIAGTQLRVPEVGVSKNDASTFKPYNPNEIIGSTAPGLPYIAPPSNVSCKQTIGIILAAAIRVVSQFVGSIVSKMPVIGFLGPIIGAHGEVQAQLYEKLFDLRQHFDWGAVAAAAVTTLIPTGTTTAAKIALGAARAAASYTISYGVNRMMGKDPSFSLRSMAAATATGAVSGALAAKVPSGVTDGLVSGTVKGIAFDWSRVSMEAVLSSTVQNVAVSALNKGITQAITGERQSWDPAAMLADAFGNALGNTVSRAITPIVDDGRRQVSTPQASEPQSSSTGFVQGQTASGFGMRFGVYPDEDAMGRASVSTSSNSEPVKELDRVTVTGIRDPKNGGFQIWNSYASSSVSSYAGFVKTDQPIRFSGPGQTMPVGPLRNQYRLPAKSIPSFDPVTNRRAVFNDRTRDTESGQFARNVFNYNDLARTRDANRFRAEFGLNLGESYNHIFAPVSEGNLIEFGVGDNYIGAGIKFSAQGVYGTEADFTYGEGVSANANVAVEAKATYAEAGLKGKLGTLTGTADSTAYARGNVQTTMQYRNGRYNASLGGAVAAEAVALRGVVEYDAPTYDLVVIEVQPGVLLQGNVAGIGGMLEGGFYTLKNGSGVKLYWGAGLTPGIGGNVRANAAISIAPRVYDAYGYIRNQLGN